MCSAIRCFSSYFNTGCCVLPQVFIKMSFSSKQTFENFWCCFFSLFVIFLRFDGFVYRKWCEALLGLCVDFLSYPAQYRDVLGVFSLHYVRWTTDPVELWSSSGSEAYREMEHFNSHFGPFFRIEQIIVKLKRNATGAIRYTNYSGPNPQFVTIILNHS